MQRFLEIDARLSQRLRVAERPGLPRKVAAILAHSGDSWFWAAGLLLLWWQGSPEWKQRAQLLLLAILITAGVVLLVKFTVRRRRPEGQWGRIYRSTDPHSFPSGHAVRAVMLAILAVGMGPAWFAVLLVLWAPLVGLARVAMGVHYLSDVLAGMALGLVMGFALGAVLRIF